MNPCATYQTRCCECRHFMTCRLLTGQVNADLRSACRKVDPRLWTTRRRFGVAGGPDEVVLTDEGDACGDESMGWQGHGPPSGTQEEQGNDGRM